MTNVEVTPDVITDIPDTELVDAHVKDGYIFIGNDVRPVNSRRA
jgi:hypothetical protein